MEQNPNNSAHAEDEMLTFKATVSFTKEFSLKMSDYPEHITTVDQMIALEKQALEDDPGAAIDGGNLTVTVEKVDP